MAHGYRTFLGEKFHDSHHLVGVLKKKAWQKVDDCQLGLCD